MQNKYDQNRLNETPAIKQFFHDIPANIAENAYRNTSHFPERASSIIRADYAKDLLNDKQEILNTIHHAQKRGATIKECYLEQIEIWFQAHRQSVKQKYITYLHSHANVASSFICGPANFPVARMQKRGQWADNHYNNINTYRAFSKKQILKSLLPYGDGHEIKTNDPDANNKIKNKIDALEKQRDTMKAINKTVRKYYKRTDKPAPGDGKYEQCIEALAHYGYNQATTEKLIKPNYIGYVVPFEPYQLTNLGAEIRRLKQRNADVANVKQTEINDEFKNGETATISDDGKIVIHFGYKPDEKTRTKLKAHAFKWSRTRIAWVRKLTANARADYYNHIKPMLN